MRRHQENRVDDDGNQNHVLKVAMHADPEHKLAHRILWRKRLPHGAIAHHHALQLDPVPLRPREQRMARLLLLHHGEVVDHNSDKEIDRKERPDHDECDKVDRGKLVVVAHGRMLITHRIDAEVHNVGPVLKRCKLKEHKHRRENIVKAAPLRTPLAIDHCRRALIEIGPNTIDAQHNRIVIARGELSAKELHTQDAENDPEQEAHHDDIENRRQRLGQRSHDNFHAGESADHTQRTQRTQRTQPLDALKESDRKNRHNHHNHVKHIPGAAQVGLFHKSETHHNHFESHLCGECSSKEQIGALDELFQRGVRRHIGPVQGKQQA
eukprot:comp22322_c0_seq1/m.53547 comp22322_c0_seq1/g.53547  ORF comp22322_c0_seq1/g.53547 comp22322_c0_seq1/m.53547 type:complete len:324 (+) comp22322_c0_seq1:1458-2429(+)